MTKEDQALVIFEISTCCLCHKCRSQEIIILRKWGEKFFYFYFSRYYYKNIVEKYFLLLT